MFDFWLKNLVRIHLATISLILLPSIDLGLKNLGFSGDYWSTWRKLYFFTCTIYIFQGTQLAISCHSFFHRCHRNRSDMYNIIQTDIFNDKDLKFYNLFKKSRDTMLPSVFLGIGTQYSLFYLLYLLLFMVYLVY